MQFAKLERVLGDYGGQRAPLNGYSRRPRWASTADVQPRYRRCRPAGGCLLAGSQRSGAPADSGVAGTRAGTLGQDSMHVFVGTADTFCLDGPAHRLDAVRGLNADAHFTYIDGRTHFDLYRVGDDRGALFDQIGAEMWGLRIMADNGGRVRRDSGLVLEPDAQIRDAGRGAGYVVRRSGFRNFRHLDHRSRDAVTTVRGPHGTVY